LATLCWSQLAGWLQQRRATDNNGRWEADGEPIFKRRSQLKNKAKPESSIRFGLCCIFLEQPIRFRNTTVKAIRRMDRDAALDKLSGLCMTNAEALQASLQFCAGSGIGCFRVNSQILPLKTHAECGYDVSVLPDGDEVVRRFKACGEFARTHDIRLCFHLDQFVVLNSPRPDVVDRSIEELEYQAHVAEWIGADVVNIHGGGAYGDKPDALARFARNLNRLSDRVRRRLTVENDDTSYTPSDLLPLCRAENIPLVYDVHHHRCNQDDLLVADATAEAIVTWDREPMFHISSPIKGWTGPHPRRHHDFINLRDFPQHWNELTVTVEVEAKAKEVAVLKLIRQLSERWFVYILRCADGSLYTGIAKDVNQRLEQHNAGMASRYTRGRLPVTVIYREGSMPKGTALRRELAIKALSRKSKEALTG
jgi:UV DNA damage endonuclease